MDLSYELCHLRSILTFEFDSFIVEYCLSIFHLHEIVSNPYLKKSHDMEFHDSRTRQGIVLNNRSEVG